MISALPRKSTVFGYSSMMTNAPVIVMAFAFFLLFSNTSLLASTDEKTAATPPANDATVITKDGSFGPPSDRFWLLDAGFRYYRLKDKDSLNNLSGPAGYVGFGMTYFAAQNLFISASGDIIMGPWSRLRNNTFEGDFIGSGAELQLAWNPFVDTIRTDEYAPLIGLSSSFDEFNGRSIGNHRSESSDPQSRDNAYLEKSYRVTISTIWITPFIGLSHFKKPRQTGNTMELLTNRIEGASSTLGVGIPVSSRYRAQIQKRLTGDDPKDPVRDIVEKGRLSGVSVIFSVKSWLGT